MDFRNNIKSQYHASLAMLKETIEKSPAEIWHEPQDQNQFWNVAYHALFFTHLYLSNSESEFKAWELHRHPYQELGPKPWPPEVQKFGEYYTREEMLAYLDFCWKFVDQQIPALNPEAESGFHWLPLNKLELQFYNIRHLQQHTGELMERLGTRAGIDVYWKGSLP